ncbi:MAG TPA: penicillin-binding protein 1C [Burkholderiales bacterium]|nr:penicillin-binding protein 1C [Burkholderiales bacterium]
MRRVALGVLAVVVVLSVAAMAALHTAPFEVVPYEAVRAQWRSSDAWLLDRNGEPLSRVRIDKSRRRGEWVELRDASPALAEMVLAAEDRRFRSHGGVDWLALAGGVRETSAGGRRGASTIPMQVAAALHPPLERSGRRDAWQKWRQMRQAIALDRSWSKDELLEAWLNLTPFRGELEGVDAASRALFGKRASGLDRAESALLAALVRSPNAPPMRVAARACALLSDDREACEAAQSLVARGLAPRWTTARLDGDAPHLARRLLTVPGEKLRSTLDARLQRFAAETLERHLRELHERNVDDGAAIVLDNESGEVLAWVGSAGPESGAAEVDGVLAPRQPGSTMKPFLYALALERKLLTAASLIDDSSFAITTPAGLYVPQNYDHSFRGPVSLRTALASSLNVPAVRTLALLGYESFHERLRALGFDTLRRDADHYGYSLALGGAEVTLLALANAYRTLAKLGAYSQIRLRPDAALSSVQLVFDPRAAYLVGEILADASARAPTFGLANPLATRFPASVKTGTSTDMRDNWALGYSSRYTVGVWVGNFSGEPMHEVSGVSGAAPVWREIMDFLHEGEAPPAPKAPGGMRRQRIAYAEGIEPPREEWFLEGTAVTLVTRAQSSEGRPRIVSPPDGARLAVDPDIPGARQRVAVVVAGARPGMHLRIDSRILPATRPQLWQPAPGRRIVRLLDEGGNEVDRVQVMVRGVR